MSNAPYGSGGGPVIRGEIVPAAQPVPLQPLPGQPPVVMLAPEKSVATAFVLTFFFGPLGMLYSTVVGGLVMLGIDLVVSVVGWILTAISLGLGLFLLIPAYIVIAIVCLVWSCMAASAHNERQRATAHAMAYGAGAPVGYR
ncbi:hypothetical protein ACXET9_02680 [Brachybacterium sp. DNPG3]